MAALNKSDKLDIRTLTENENDDEMKIREGGTRYEASLLNFKEFLNENVKQMTGITPTHKTPALYGLRYEYDGHKIVGLQMNGDEITGNGNCLFDSLLYIENDGPYSGSTIDRLEEVRQLRVELFTHSIVVEQRIEYTDIVREPGKPRKSVHKVLNPEVAISERSFVPAEMIKTFCDLKQKHIMLFTIYETGTLNVDIYLNRTVPLEQIDFVILHHSHFTTLRRKKGFSKSQKDSPFLKKLVNQTYTVRGGETPTYGELCSGGVIDEFDERILVIPYARRYSELYMGLFHKPHRFHIVDNETGPNYAHFLRAIEESKKNGSNQSVQSIWETPNLFGIQRNNLERLDSNGNVGTLKLGNSVLPSGGWGGRNSIIRQGNNNLDAALQRSRQNLQRSRQNTKYRSARNNSRYAPNVGFGPIPHNYQPVQDNEFQEFLRRNPLPKQHIKPFNFRPNISGPTNGPAQAPAPVNDLQRQLDEIRGLDAQELEEALELEKVLEESRRTAKTNSEKRNREIKQKNNTRRVTTPDDLAINNDYQRKIDEVIEHSKRTARNERDKRIREREQRAQRGQTSQTSQNNTRRVPPNKPVTNRTNRRVPATRRFFKPSNYVGKNVSRRAKSIFGQWF
jgi:hypothetical protein